MLRDPKISQETTLEVYLHVWANAHLFDPGKGSAQAWLTTLTHRFAVERVRCKPGRAARILGCGNGNRAGGCYYIIDEVRHHMVCADADALNDWQRETIALAYYGGMTYQQVAEFLGEALPTVRSRIRAGVIRLGESLPTK